MSPEKKQQQTGLYHLSWVVRANSERRELKSSLSTEAIVSVRSSTQRVMPCVTPLFFFQVMVHAKELLVTTMPIACHSTTVRTQRRSADVKQAIRGMELFVAVS